MSKKQMIQADIDRFLDGFLCREESAYTTKKDEFRNEWYALEKEYND